MRVLFISIAVLLCIPAVAQNSTRKLPRNVNRTNTDNFFPVVTPDGRTIYYFTNYTNFGDIEIRFTEMQGNSWSNPKDPDRDLYRANLNHKGSLFISYSGKEIYFSTRKSPTIGGYDINVADFRDGNVGQPKNIGKPVNSALQEGAPSASIDGNELYFMRCAKMDADGEQDCKLYVAERKSSGLWNEPVELPGAINAGDTRFPLIFPDGQTLVYSSNSEGSDFDLYMTRKSGSGWSEPVALDFLNTPQDELRISASLPGDYIFHAIRDEEGDRSLVMTRLPDPFLPKSLMMLKGHVFDNSNNPLNAIIQAMDVSSGDVITHTESEDGSGSFEMILVEGKEYDFSIFPRDNRHTYYSQRLNLIEMAESDRQFLDVELSEIRERPVMPLNGLFIDTLNANLPESSGIAVNRLAYLLRQNPDTNIEIGAFINNYREDTVQAEGLTEVRMDTVFKDSIVAVVDSLLTREYLNHIDSVLDVANDSEGIDNLDSLKRVVLSYKPIRRYDTIQVEHMIKVYHNDKTQKFAEAVLRALSGKNISESRITAKGYREEIWYDLEFPGNMTYLIAVRFR